MENIAGDQSGQSSSVWTVSVASLIGTTIEWFDYNIYGATGALVLNQIFFPEFSALAGTLAVFATFAVGFFARPVGGVIFGHFGDRIGRKGMLITTLMLMGVATALIGLLPTYAAIGVLSPILLIVLRLIQGFGLGGEWGGAALMISEHAPENRRGFFASAPQMGAAAGLFLANAVIFGTAALMSEDAFNTWGWRIPFLVSIILVLVGLFIRLRITESQEFTRVKETNTLARVPVLDVFRTSAKNVFIAAGVASTTNVVFWTGAVFMTAYGTSQLGLQNSTMLSFVIIVAAVYFFALPVFGALSDRIGRRRLITIGVIGMAVFAFPFFLLVNTGNPIVVLLAMVLFVAIIQAVAYAPQSSFIPELFDTRVRYSGSGIGYNLANMVFGGTAPFVGTALVALGGGSPWLLSAYIIAVCAMGCVALLFATQVFRINAPTADQSYPVAQSAERAEG